MIPLKKTAKYGYFESTTFPYVHEYNFEFNSKINVKTLFKSIDFNMIIFKGDKEIYTSGISTDIIINYNRIIFK